MGGSGLDGGIGGVGSRPGPVFLGRLPPLKEGGRLCWELLMLGDELLNWLPGLEVPRFSLGSLLLGSRLATPEGGLSLSLWSLDCSALLGEEDLAFSSLFIDWKECLTGAAFFSKGMIFVFSRGIIFGFSESADTLESGGDAGPSYEGEAGVEAGGDAGVSGEGERGGEAGVA